jgi:VanZ family protein
MIEKVKKNIFSLLTALIILYLSLAKADTFDKVDVFEIPHLDKIVHFCMYFTLMITLLYENRSKVENIKNQIFLAAISLLYGIIMEFLQSWITITRTGDFFDAIFNLIGISLALIAWRSLGYLIKRKN